MQGKLINLYQRQLYRYASYKGTDWHSYWTVPILSEMFNLTLDRTGIKRWRPRLLQDTREPTQSIEEFLRIRFRHLFTSTSATILIVITAVQERMLEDRDVITRVSYLVFDTMEPTAAGQTDVIGAIMEAKRLGRVMLSNREEAILLISRTLQSTAELPPTPSWDMLQPHKHPRRPSKDSKRDLARV